ncbi:RinA family protein [Clostridium perfringens]|uniref:RinA family protein n=1 Tax=Clostridium perfringens TaxID=1502 RepID=UPI001C84645F|nr:RinA family protein [Clostridium perfringens]MDU1258353.1 RinA family protein [Clostridium perfringens]
MDKTLFKKTENLLGNYNTLETEIKLIEAEIKDIQESYTGCGAIGYNEKSGPTNKFSSMVEDEVIRKEKDLFYLKRDLDYKVRLKRRIDLAIQTLRTKEERDLIRLRYINQPKVSWGTVARHLKYNKDYCRKELRPKVIKQIADFVFYNPGVQERFIV